MFNNGDRVQLGKGKTVWTVFFQNEAGADPEHVQLKSDKGATRLAKVTDVTLIEAAKKSQETIEAVIRDLEPAHIPGESPAAYKLRTGLKLDGRRTSFGRALLIALQPKLRPIGVKTRRGQGRVTRRG